MDFIVGFICGILLASIFFVWYVFRWVVKHLTVLAERDMQRRFKLPHKFNLHHDF